MDNPLIFYNALVYLLVKDPPLQNYAEWSILRRWRGKKEYSCAKLKPRDIMLENI